MTIKILTTSAFLCLSSWISAQSLTDSLVASYPFNGNAQDVSGNGYHLTVQNAILTNGRHNQPNGAYYFNGTNAGLYITGENEFYSNEYTYSVWFKVSSLPTTGKNETILAIGGSAKDCGISISNKYLNQFSGLGVWSYSGSTSSANSIQDGSFNSSGWHHIVSVQTDDSLLMYLDGQFVKSVYTGGAPGYSGSNLGLFIGFRSGFSQPFTGTLDDVRIWKRALNSGEVKTLYQNISTDLETPSNDVNTLNLTAYPNPAMDKLYLAADGQEKLYYSIFDMKGLCLEEQHAYEGSISLENYMIGLYWVEVFTDKGASLGRKKIVIAR